MLGAAVYLGVVANEMNPCDAFVPRANEQNLSIHFYGGSTASRN